MQNGYNRSFNRKLNHTVKAPDRASYMLYFEMHNIKISSVFFFTTEKWCDWRMFVDMINQIKFFDDYLHY